MKAKNFLLKWIWLLPLLIWFVLTAQAKLSNETQEIVNDLRWKHYGYGSLICTDVDTLYYDTFSHWSWTMSFDNGILTIETQDGTWFIEMQRKEE